MRLEYFQLLDAIVELAPDEGRIATEALVPHESTVFEGHFPGYPLMPGVLLIETMAQTCGTMVMALNKFERLPLLVGVKNAKLRRFVEPRTLILGRGVLEHDGSGYAVAKGELRAVIDGKEERVANAELTYTLIPWPRQDLKDFMLGLISELQNAPPQQQAAS